MKDLDMLRRFSIPLAPVLALLLYRFTRAYLRRNWKPLALRLVSGAES